MKRLAFCALALGVTAFSALAAEFKGVIADSDCAAKMGAKTAAAGHADCAKACIKKGAKAVLVTPKGQVYKLDDQAKVVPHAGHEVTIDGKLEGDTIHVNSVKM